MAAPKIKFKATVDARRLEKSVRKAAKAFGENSHDATARLGLQAARGLSGSTQVFGRDWKKTQDIQRGAIYRDLANIFAVVPDGNKVISDVRAAKEIHAKERTSDGRTRKIMQRIPITFEAKLGLLQLLFRRAGMAKSAWIGSARHLERKQGKGFQIRFGKAYSEALKKWEKMGSGTQPQRRFSTSLTLTNSVAHTAKNRVLKRGRIATELQLAQRNTLKWYEKATEGKLKKLERESTK